MATKVIYKNFRFHPLEPLVLATSRTARGTLPIMTISNPYSTEQAARPPWLTSLLGDTAPAPRIYNWAPPGHAESSRAPDPRRIHILGVGNLGRLYAASLAKIEPNPPPITLILHRRELLDQWNADPGVTIIRNVIKNGTSVPVPETIREGLDVEYWTDEPDPAGSAREINHIDNLIVTTKADIALAQVDRLRRYLDASSTVALAQNGMSRLWPPHGSVYVSHRWPNTSDAPCFAACITTHGVLSHGPFRSEHASPADAKFGLVLPGAHNQATYLSEAITTAPDLLSRPVSRADLWVLQLEKLVANSIINSISAIMRCKNGVIFADNDKSAVLVRVMDRLLQEISRVYQALVNHPSVDGILTSTDSVGGGTEQENIAALRKQLTERFAVGPLTELLWAIGYKVRDNTSSMLQDVNAGKKTEIRDFNGWIVDMAHFLDPTLDVSGHEALIDIVESREALDAEALGKAVLS